MLLRYNPPRAERARGGVYVTDVGRYRQCRRSRGASCGGNLLGPAAAKREHRRRDEEDGRSRKKKRKERGDPEKRLWRNTATGNPTIDHRLWWPPLCLQLVSSSSASSSTRSRTSPSFSSAAIGRGFLLLACHPPRLNTVDLTLNEHSRYGKSMRQRSRRLMSQTVKLDREMNRQWKKR